MIKLKSLLKEANLQEDYPTNFSMDTFKALPSFAKRIQYCVQNLKKIGSGSSRIVYKIDDEKVLKLAKNKKGIAQNSVERDYYIHQAYHDIVAKVFDIDDNDLWIEMELARRVTGSEFSRVMGFSIIHFGYYLMYLSNQDEGKPYEMWRSYMKEEEFKKIEDSEFAKNIMNLVRELDLAVGDFGRISTYGEVLRDGKPTIVLIDVGLSKSVYKDFYSK